MGLSGTFTFMVKSTIQTSSWKMREKLSKVSKNVAKMVKEKRKIQNGFSCLSMVFKKVLWSLCWSKPIGNRQNAQTEFFLCYFTGEWHRPNQGELSSHCTNLGGPSFKSHSAIGFVNACKSAKAPECTQKWYSQIRERSQMHSQTSWKRSRNCPLSPNCYV